MKSTSNINTLTDSKQGQIKAVLYLLQSFIDDFKKEVDGSYELLKLDVMTDFTNKIDQTLKNHPFENMFTLSKDIDDKVIGILNDFVKTFLKEKKSIISHASRCKAGYNELHYVIILKDDNIENRDKIFQFIYKYDLFEISEKYPVNFHFVPTELLDKVKSIENIKFH